LSLKRSSLFVRVCHASCWLTYQHSFIRINTISRFCCQCFLDDKSKDLKYSEIRSLGGGHIGLVLCRIGNITRISTRIKNRHAKRITLFIERAIPAENVHYIHAYEYVHAYSYVFISAIKPYN